MTGLVLCLVVGYGLFLTLPNGNTEQNAVATPTIPPPAKLKAAAVGSDVSTATDAPTPAYLNQNNSTETPQLATPALIPETVPLRRYLEITTGCETTIDETCARSYSRPTTTSRERAALRIGMVLMIKESTTTPNGEIWHEIDFDEYLRYPDRLTLPWFVRDDAGLVVETNAPTELSTTTPETTKRIVVDRSEQLLYAYEADVLHATYTISTGREFTPTPLGTFRVFKKMPSRYMQGPIPGITDKFYDLPGVPWNLYFTNEGAIVHGAYWHNGFGRPYSNGCVNTKLTDAKAIYDWAPLGTLVTVRP